MRHKDPIEEIWAIREELGAEKGYDVHRLFERLRREEEKYADRLVRVAPRERSGSHSSEERPRMHEGRQQTD
jgi:hypothetical protein